MQNLPLSIVKTVLELTERFTTEVSGGWQRTPETPEFCEMTRNPPHVRRGIERHNKAVGPRQWDAVRGSGAKPPWAHRLLATPPITKKLKGYKCLFEGVDLTFIVVRIGFIN